VHQAAPIVLCGFATLDWLCWAS